ncbi:hypothetical protein BX666DRAFT_1972846 [Dichotomocladium elegans]|nr:hypothetical protein BX666DRAFT_1972846 [Dichotomocladium elegans]
MSVLPPATMAFQSNLDIVDNDRRKYHHFHQRKSRRSTTTAPGIVFPAPPAPRQFTALLLEAVFAKVLDALIFTSALAITAYNYWTGELAKTATPAAATVEKPTITKAGPTPHDNSHYSHRDRDVNHRHCHKGSNLVAVEDHALDARQWRHTHPPYRSSLFPTDRIEDRVLLEDAKWRRTLEWAESVAQTPMTGTDGPLDMVTSHSTHSDSSNRSLERRHRRLRAPSSPITIETATEARSPVESGPCHNAVQENGKEDEMLARMEEQLQSLIEQGQAALTSRVADMEAMDESKMVGEKDSAN